jgi:hypothetical protein
VRGASDLHGFLPAVEPCDVLLLAGDLVPLEAQEDTGLSWRWFSEVFAKWVDEVPAGEVVAIAGNHDFMLQKRIASGVHTRGIVRRQLDLPARRRHDTCVRPDGVGETMVARHR